VSDLFTTVQKVQRMLARTYFKNEESAIGQVESGSFNIAVQDGKESGQTVPHVHCHIIPRTKGNSEGDGIYDRLQGEEGNVGGGLWDRDNGDRRPESRGKFPVIEDAARMPRSAEEMNKEAAFFKEQMELVED
jgi:bis(5'-adenosyl)-triphosphatase